MNKLSSTEANGPTQFEMSAGMIATLVVPLAQFGFRTRDFAFSLLALGMSLVLYSVSANVMSHKQTWLKKRVYSVQISLSMLVVLGHLSGLTESVDFGEAITWSLVALGVLYGLVMTVKNCGSLRTAQCLFCFMPIGLISWR